MSIDKVTADDKKHLGDVTCIVYHDGNLFSSGSDGKVKVNYKIIEMFFYIFNKVLVDLGLGSQLQKGVKYS